MHTPPPATKKKGWYFILVVTCCQGHTSWGLPRPRSTSFGQLGMVTLTGPRLCSCLGAELAMTRRLLEKPGGTQGLRGSRVTHAKSLIKK